MSNTKSRGTGLVTRVVEIEPRDAQAILDNAGSNRKLNPKTVERYAAIMKAGAWDLNGETIKVDKDGKLIDGQHRLAACVVAGVPFTTVVVHGLASDEAFLTVDVGVKRSVRSYLEYKGYTYTSLLAATCKRILLLDAGALESDPDHMSVAKAAERNLRIDAKSIEELAAKHPVLRGLCAWCTALIYPKNVIPSSVLTVAAFYLSRRGAKRLAHAKDWLEAMASGHKEGLPSIRGATMAYRSLIRFGRGKSQRALWAHRFGLVLSGWNVDHGGEMGLRGGNLYPILITGKFPYDKVKL